MYNHGGSGAIYNLDNINARSYINLESEVLSSNNAIIGYNKLSEISWVCWTSSPCQGNIYIYNICIVFLSATYNFSLSIVQYISDLSVILI